MDFLKIEYRNFYGNCLISIYRIVVGVCTVAGLILIKPDRPLLFYSYFIGALLILMLPKKKRVIVHKDAIEFKERDFDPRYKNVESKGILFYRISDYSIKPLIKISSLFLRKDKKADHYFVRISIKRTNKRKRFNRIISLSEPELNELTGIFDELVGLPNKKIK